MLQSFSKLMNGGCSDHTHQAMPYNKGSTSQLPCPAQDATTAGCARTWARGGMRAFARSDLAGGCFRHGSSVVGQFAGVCWLASVGG